MEMSRTLVMVVFNISLIASTYSEEDATVMYANKCELCQLVAKEIELSFDESGQTHEVLINTKGERRSYLTSEVRFIESMDGLCEGLGEYRMHKEFSDLRRFQKRQSTTMKTLHGLKDKGVKVDLGMPEELWDEPSVEIGQLQQDCNRLVEDQEDLIETWYRQRQDSLTPLLCATQCADEP